MILTAEHTDWTVEEIVENGAFALVDKREAWTSFDVVNKIRASLRHYMERKKIKVGHAGTLDPMATGLLIIGIGPFTKKMESVQAQSKTYLAELKLGATTASYDREADEENLCDAAHIKENDILSVLPSFIGDILQPPPIYSAISIKGVRAYQLARRGEDVEMKMRPVVINSIDLIEYSFPYVRLRVHCGKGTYIRSLAHDIGEKLGVGAYLSDLRRELIGDYSVEGAWDVLDFTEKVNSKKQKHPSD